jgi:F0F1-type ATP synthase delta subunit
MIAPQAPKREGDEAPPNELRDFLLGIPLGGDQRKDVIDTLGKEVKMQKETVDFLKLLVDTNRLDCIDSIISTFEDAYNELTDTQVRFISHPK